MYSNNIQLQYVYVHVWKMNSIDKSKLFHQSFHLYKPTEPHFLNINSGHSNFFNLQDTISISLTL